MRGKIIFVVGLATGYVLGTRAGRERYEQIKAGAEKVWNTSTVQAGVQKVQDFAGARVDTVKADLSNKARNALGALIGRDPLNGPQQTSKASAAGSTRAKPAATSATKSPARPTSTTSKTTSKSAAAGQVEADAATTAPDAPDA